MFIPSKLIALLLAVPLSLHAGELLDRIVATVNNHVILQSDWDDEVRFEAFMSGRKPEDVSAEQRRAALDRLIDQGLMREQMRMTQLKPAADEIKKQIDDLKGEQLREHPGRSWKMTLSRYQLTNKIVEEHVAAELEQLQLVDLRFRASIQVSAADIEKYYREQIVPKLPASDPLALKQAAPKIKEILIQEKINQSLNLWLETLRSQAQIQVLAADKPSDLQASPQGTR
jgi:hypothetical protein